MARPRRPPKPSPSLSPIPLAGVALSLFAAIAAGFLASRALKKRSASAHLLRPRPANSDLPALRQSLPNGPPSPSSSRSSNDDPALQVVVGQEIARYLQDEKIEEQSPVAEVRAVVTVEEPSITVPEFFPRVNGIETSAVECKLKVYAPVLIDEDGAARVLVEMSPASIDQGLENNIAEARREGTPVEEARNESEKVGKRVVETSIVLKTLADPDNACIQALQACSEVIRKDQSLPEQSLVLINAKTSKFYAEVYSDEDHDELSNGSGLSDFSICSVDSLGSLQEVSSAAVRPLDPCLEEGEDAKVSTLSAEFRPSLLDASAKDCLTPGEESDEQLTVDKAETIESANELSVQVDCKLNSNENGAVALISPEYEISIELPSSKQLYSIAHESAQVQESVGPLTSNSMFVSQPLDSKGNSSQSDREISASRSDSNESQEAPQSSVGTADNENEETMGVRKEDSAREIIDVEEEMEALAEAPPSSVLDNENDETMGVESKQDSTREIVDVEEEMEVLAELPQSSVGTADNENEETMGAESKQDNTREVIDFEEEMEALAEAPQSSVGTADKENEETMGAESKQDSTREIINGEEEMEAFAESTDARVSTKAESSGESLSREEILNEMPDLENNFIDEETLQSHEELDSCSSSGDNDVRLSTGSLDRKQETSTKRLDTTNDSVESSNDIDTEPQRFRRISLVEQNVWPNEQLQLDPQDVVSETKEIKACEQDRKQQTDQIVESKKFILQDVDLNKTFQRRTELSGDHMKVQKGMLAKFAGSIGLEMALICVLIGLMSTFVWFLRILSVRDTKGVTAQN